MSRIDGLLHRLRVLRRGERYADEQAREMAFHLELEAQAQTRADDPALAARRAFGNVTVQREAARGASALNVIDRVRQDTRYALRGLRRQPGFTAMVVITLALGFGVNAAMFSLVDAIFLHAPDGIVAPDGVRRLYDVETEFSDQQRVAFDGFEYPHYRAMLAADPTLPVALVGQLDSAAIGIGAARDVNASRIDARVSEVSRSYFPLLGVRPLFGRFFLPEEDSVATPTPVAVISEAIWRGAFKSDPHVLGRRITIGRRPFTVVGVAGQGFRGIDLDACDLWVPWNTHQNASDGMPGPWYETFGIGARVIARVHSPSEEAKLDGVAQRALRSTVIKYLKLDSDLTVVTGPIVASRGPGRASTGVALTGRIAWVALLVLAIAVTNVVNLLLLRAARRKREMALRRALGVSRGRLLVQLTIEGMLLATIGGGAAIIVAWWAGSALRSLVLPSIRWAHPAVTGATIVFLLVMSLVVGILAGIAPAFHGSGDDLLDALRAGQRDSGYRGSRARATLLGMQAALCAVLLVGAGLFVRSLQNVRGIDVGYDVQNLTSYAPQFTDRVTNHADALRQTIPQLARELARTPGVRAVAYSSIEPMRGDFVTRLFLSGGAPFPLNAQDRQGPTGLEVSPNFFDAVGTSVVAGRTFSDADAASAPPVMMINQTFARMVWPNENVLGKCVVLGESTDVCRTIVGVVRDVHRVQVIESPTMLYYLPLTQAPAGLPAPMPDVIIVRAQPGAGRTVAPLIARRVRDAFPAAEDVSISPMSAQIDRQLRSWSLGAALFTAFGVLAFAVAGVGVYSVVAYGAAQRTHEMGIRIALGARTSEIVDLVLAEGLRAVVVGVVVGLAASVMLGRFIASMLFGVTPTDPSIMILVTVALCVLAAVASLVPALRASRVDPVIALRSD